MNLAPINFSVIFEQLIGWGIYDCEAAELLDPDLSKLTQNVI